VQEPVAATAVAPQEVFVPNPTVKEQLNAILREIIEKIVANPHYIKFKDPVSLRDFPEYTKFVAVLGGRMDLGMIVNNCNKKRGGYKLAGGDVEWMGDVRKIGANARQYARKVRFISKPTHVGPPGDVNFEPELVRTWLQAFSIYCPHHYDEARKTSPVQPRVLALADTMIALAAELDKAVEEEVVRRESDLRRLNPSLNLKRMLGSDQLTAAMAAVAAAPMNEGGDLVPVGWTGVG